MNLPESYLKDLILQAVRESTGDILVLLKMPRHFMKEFMSDVALMLHRKGFSITVNNLRCSIYIRGKCKVYFNTYSDPKDVQVAHQYAGCCFSHVIFNEPKVLSKAQGPHKIEDYIKSRVR